MYNKNKKEDVCMYVLGQLSVWAFVIILIVAFFKKY